MLTTEEIVATLRHCATHNCIMCPAYSPPSSKCFETLAAACDRMEELEKELSACISDMTAYVQRKIRDECDLCKRAAPREFCREADYHCALCNHTAGCVCARCRAGDQFEWRGVPVTEPPKE